MTLMNKIPKLISKEALSVTQIALRTGRRRASVQDVIGKLMIMGIIRRVSRGVYRGNSS